MLHGSFPFQVTVTRGAETEAIDIVIVHTAGCKCLICIRSDVALVTCCTDAGTELHGNAVSMPPGFLVGIPSEAGRREISVTVFRSELGRSVGTHRESSHIAVLVVQVDTAEERLERVSSTDCIGLADFRSDRVHVE